MTTTSQPPAPPAGTATTPGRRSAGQRRKPPTATARRRPIQASLLTLQALAVETVLLAVLLAAVRGLLAAVVVAVLGALLLVVILARRQGRWWLEERIIAWSFRGRRRRHGSDQAGDPRLAALRGLAPGLAAVDVTAADGSRVGVARDDAGWFAVVVVDPAEPMRDDTGAPVAIDRLVAAIADVGQPGSVLQVVRHTVCMPAPGADAAKPAALAYLQLLADVAPRPVPMHVTTWVAVRLEARTLAEAGVSSGDDAAAAPAVVAALARRLAKSLRAAGVRTRTLNADGLVAALAQSCDLEPVGPGREMAQHAESWTGWVSPRLAHRTYWVRTWPPLAQASALLHTLSTMPGAVTSVALILVPEDETVDLRCLARVAAPAAALPGICRSLVGRARQAGARLLPLDGEHGPATYASAPTGGGSR